MLKTFDVILDVEKELHSITMPAFNLSQSDKDSIEITFHVNQDNAAFDLTDKTVQIAIKKPSGLTVYQNCSIVDAVNGESSIILDKQAYIEYGFYTGELMISDVDQMIVTTPFYYGVRTAIMAAQAEESINDWSALENALFNMDKKPLLIEGVPTTLPEYIGQTALDTLGRRAFFAYDLTNTGWQLIAAGEGGSGVVYWTDILNKPLTFAPTAHTHTMAEVDGLTAALDSKADIGETTGGGAVEWVDVLNKPLSFPAEPHTHAMAEVTGLITALDGKADNADLAAYAPVDHVHTFAAITNKPDTYTPTAHTHAMADVTGLQAALDGKADDADLAAKADLTHTHTAANITDFAAGVAANIPAEYLTQTEGDARYLQGVPAEYLTQTEGDARYAIKGATEGTTAISWGDIAGTLANQADLQTALNGKADDADLAAKADLTHTHTTAAITDFAAGVAAAIPPEYLTETEGDARYMAAGTSTEPAAHTHDWTDITGTPTTLDGYGITDAASDADLMDHANYQNGEIARLDGRIDGKADTGHTHTVANITDFAAGVAANIPAEYLTGSEGDAAYAPKTHTHTAANITDFAAGVVANIPAEYVTETEGAAAYAPKTHTHTAANITDFAAGVAGAIPAEYLTATEGNAAYQPKGTYLTAVPLMSGAAIGGAMVGNGLAMSGNYLYAKAGAGLGIAADNSLQVQTTRTTPTPVKFWTGTAAEYTAVTTKDANTLYFVTG